jgi:hypothetical protein
LPLLSRIKYRPGMIRASNCAVPCQVPLKPAPGAPFCGQEFKLTMPIKQLRTILVRIKVFMLPPICRAVFCLAEQSL